MRMLPRFQRDAPVLVERREAFPDLGNNIVDKAVAYIDCDRCTHQGWDGSFTAFPDRAITEPDQFSAAIRGLVTDESRRKCPMCNALAKPLGIRMFCISGTLAKDLMVEFDVEKDEVSMSFLDAYSYRPERREPKNRDLRVVCADTCLRTALMLSSSLPGREDEAALLLRRVIASRPGDAEARLALAKAAFAEGRLDAALAEIDHATPGAMKDETTALVVGNLLGAIALERNESNLLTLAVQWYERVLAKDPTHGAASLALGRLFIQSGNLDLAASHLEVATKSAEHAAEAAYFTGVMHLKQQRDSTALLIFKRLEREIPSDPEILHMLAWALSRTGRKQEALETLQRAEKLEPDRDRTEMFRTLVEEESSTSERS